MAQRAEQRNLTIAYGDYVQEQNGYFPSEIHVKAQEADKTTTIDITYRGVDFNTDVSFPFNIPGGLKEIEL